MTKTLTEQWRKHNLKYKQHYYLRTKDGGEDIQPFMGGFFMEESNPVVDVLSSVPSHEEWKRLLYKRADHFSQLAKKVERLQEQLNEANEVIKKFEKTEIGHKQKDGTYMLTVCGVIIDPEKRPTSAIVQEETYVYDPRPLTKYLEKWGVK